MPLLERENQLSELEHELNGALIGCGKTIIIYGEAGIGKSTLVQEFCNRHKQDIPILTGACDDLCTPAPLTPLFDVAELLNKSIVADLDSGAPRPSLFSHVFEELKKIQPYIFVIEDIHWADQSTLDLITFLCRRINKHNGLVILTYRDNEVTYSHPLNITLGNINTSYTRRIKLPVLSEKAVDYMAKELGRSNKNIYKLTGGNPFLINEILHHNTDEIPSTIKESMLSRLSKLSAESRAFVELVSVIPNRAEKWLVGKFIKDYDPIDEAIGYGIIIHDSESYSFKHELARMAVENTLPGKQKQELNNKIMNALLKEKNNEQYLARIVHHAKTVVDKDVILKYAPLAAEQAIKLGAHREAALQYAAALQYPEYLSSIEYANLLEKYAYQCYLTSQIKEALNARLKALSEWEKLGMKEKAGSNLRWLSRLSWFLGNKKQADYYADAAIKILESLETGSELAMAYSNKSQLHMLASKFEESIYMGSKAITIAEEINNIEILSHALNNVGTSEWSNGNYESGKGKLLRSLSLALENDFEEHAARAYTNIGCKEVEFKNYKEGEYYLRQGIEYSIERDLDSWKLYMQAWLVRFYFETGEWEKAGELANNIINSYNVAAISKIPALALLGWLRLRRGDPDASVALIEAFELAYETGESQRLAPVSTALLEAAWYTGNSDFLQKGEIGYSLCYNLNEPWSKGMLAYWMWRNGKLNDTPQNIADPYRLMINGKWEEAAKFWKHLGCPFEEALALSEGNSSAKLKAIEIFKNLQAGNAEEILRKKMRQEGIKNIPRKPHNETTSNIYGLTKRQQEVIKLVAEGLSNNEIALRLFLSAKTVDHHISAIFSKLNIHSRTEAAAFIHSGTLQKK